MDEMISIKFKTKTFSRLEYEEGHYFIRIPTYYSNEVDHKPIKFMLDTGAYLTIITPPTSERFKFNRIKPMKRDLPVHGFTGETTVDLVEIPGMVSGCGNLTEVKVGLAKESTMDILGLNILEHFNYYIDSTNNKIYFSENTKYKAPEELKCKLTMYPVSTAKINEKSKLTDTEVRTLHFINLTGSIERGNNFYNTYPSIGVNEGICNKLISEGYITRKFNIYTLTDKGKSIIGNII